MRRSSLISPLLAFGLLLVTLVVPATAAAPTPSGLPAITGTYRVGQTLTSTTGTFAGTQPMTMGRQWERCDAAGAACAPIGGAGATTYVLTGADEGRTIRVAVTASNVDGSATQRSPATPVIGPLDPPVSSAPPTISGTARDGQTLSMDNGAWTGAATITYTRRWQRCDAAGDNCAPGSTAATYVLSSVDVGGTVRVEVTAKNADGTAIAVSAPTAVIDGNPPVSTAPPTTGGPARSGQTLTSTAPGTWSGTTPLTYTRQWERCDASGAACAPLTGAIGTSHVLTDDDIGHTMRVVVTATNVKGSASAASVPTAVVGPKVPPASTRAPAITGTATDGLVLTADDGGWSGTAAIATTRRWQRCDAGGAACADLAGTGATLTLGPGDVGWTLRIRVTATNPDGTATAVSAATPVVAPALPSASALPAITGTTREGQVLTASTGTWKGTPTITHAYQWQSCAGATCTPITDATASTYRLAPGDVGRTIRVTVTASNAAGSATATSAATATVTTGPPANVALPDVTGPLPRDGELYTGTVGAWAGTAPLTHNLQWQRCTAAGSGCAAIVGEVSGTYRLTAADVGRTVRLEVTATNAQGSVKAQSPVSPLIGAAPPAAAADPTVVGELRDGQTLSAASTWNGTAPISLSYQWQRCEPLTGVCADILDATTASLRLTPADVGRRVRVRVGALNAAGSGVAFSDPGDPSDPTTLVVADAPRATGAPVLSGTAMEGGTLTSTTGTFTGTPPLDRTVRWQRCDDRGAACADIPGATGADRVATAADRGATLRAVVTAQNDAGSDSIASAPSAVVAAAPPRNLILPAVSPDTGLRDGAVVTATEGAWGGSEPMDIAHRWQRCAPGTTTCTDVPSAAGRTYTLTTADVGFTIRAVVTATNGAGFATQPSVPTGVVGTNPPVNTVAPTVTGTPEDGATLQATDGSWTGLVPFTTTYEWWRCNAAGASCSLVPGRTASSYALGHDDVGLTLRVKVVQSSAGGSTGVLSAATGAVAAAPPHSVVAPYITGGAAVGRELTAEAGVWSGTPELRLTYQWRRCLADGTACADIAGARSGTYRVTTDDAAGSLRVVVTATNDVGVDTATSASTAEVQTDPPAMLAAPGVEAAGIVAEGTTLTARPGTWGGAQPVTFEYRWRRCDAALGGCLDIPAASGPTYALTKDDVGRRILVIVTATNVVDVATAQTDGTPVVLPAPPVNAVPPTISAPAGLRDGARLNVTYGNWSGAPPLTHTVTWLRCDAAAAACAPLDAVGQSYTMTSGDVGHRMRARVTARNATAEVTVDSAPTGTITPSPPVSATRPEVVALDGKPTVGSRLRAVNGTWTGTAPMELAVQWQRCLATSLAACDDVPGATGAEYMLSEADVGRRLRVVVTARNAAGTVTADAVPSLTTPAVPPDSATTPTISGDPREGGALRADPGAWSGSAPLTLAYEWERCATAAAAKCTKIAGATRPTYTPVADDVAKFLRVTVTATNAGGKVTRSSLVSEEILGVAPVNVELPVVTARGAIKAGTSLSATTGRWKGTVPIKSTLQWQSCDARGVDCTDIDKATAATYALKAEDVDGTKLVAPIRVVVTATNSAGATDRASAALGARGAATGTTAAKAKGRTLPKAKVPARLRRVGLTPKGRLLVSVTCPSQAKSTCGAIVSVMLGTSRLRLTAARVARGRVMVREVKLNAVQRRRLRGKRAVYAVVSLAAPATPKRLARRRVRVKVPAALRRPAPAKRAAAAPKAPAATTSAGAATTAAGGTTPSAPAG